jgi:ABC-type sugar transport system substrate-binding protein
MKHTGGKGPIFLDLGQPGAGGSEEFKKGAERVLKKFPDVKVKTYYGQYTLGGDEKGATPLAATTPDVKGILSFGPGYGAEKALNRAGIDYVPVAAFAFNGFFKFCIEHKIACLGKANPPWLSATAIKLGLKVMEEGGKNQATDRDVEVNVPFYYTGDIKPNEKYPSAPGSEAVTPGAPDGLLGPVSAPWSDIELEDALKPPTTE